MLALTVKVRAHVVVLVEVMVKGQVVAALSLINAINDVNKKTGCRNSVGRTKALGDCCEIFGESNRGGFDKGRDQDTNKITFTYCRHSLWRRGCSGAVARTRNGL